MKSTNRVIEPKILQIVTKPTPFPEGKYAAVNAVGVAASIGHVLLEQHAKRKKPEKNDHFPKLVLLSARHEPGLFRIIDKVRKACFRIARANLP